MISLTRFWKNLPFPGWKKATALAALLVACDPSSPWYGSCDDIPPCSAYSYSVRVNASKAFVSIEVDSTTGEYLLAGAGVSLYFVPDRTLEALAKAVAAPQGGRGMAYAMSCVQCTGNVTVDSAYFTTDLVTPTNDTLKANANLIGSVLPAGIHLSETGGRLRLDSLPVPIRFRDSVFEVRFSGTIDSVRKSATAKFRVTNSALLFP